MLKRNAPIILACLMLFAADPVVPRARSVADLEGNYRDRVDAAKRGYHDEMVKANGELLAGLLELKDGASRARDQGETDRIEKRLDHLSEETTRGLSADVIGGGLAEKPNYAALELGALDLTEKRFFGVGGCGKKVLYLCDASGSMLSIFGVFKQQLKNSIDKLDSIQEFNVIFYSDDNCFPLFKDGTQKLTEENKKLAMEFINNTVCTGGTQPLPAIKFALDEKPDMVFLMTDGFDQLASFEAVTNAFKTANSDGKMQVHCIFLESDPDPKLEKALRQIAEESHGMFTKFQKGDL